MRQSRNYLQSRKWRMIFAWVAIITACFSVMIVSAKYKAPHNSVKRVTVTGKSATKQYRLVMPEQTISKGVYVRSKTFNLTAGWTGAFNDDESIGIAQYDGFNYAITGGGTATKTLSWDSTILEVDC
ncbi:MAG: hypothetical protein K6F31_03065 [Acetatifactor sp.]|nr:hypothetical protein [Acetatifactor sp.]